MVVQSTIQRLSGIVATVILARTLGPTSLGNYSVTNTTASSFYGFFRLGADFGVHVLTASMDPAKATKQINELLGAALTLFLLIGCVGCGACLLFAHTIASGLFNTPTLVDFVRVAAFLFLGQAIAQYTYVAFAGLHAFRAYVRVTLLMAPITTVLLVLGAIVGGAIGAAWGAVLGQAVTVIVLGMSLSRVSAALGLKLRPRLHGHLLKQILTVGLPFYLAGLLQIPSDYFAQGLMVRMHGVSMLGDLRVIVTITAIISFLPNALNGPMISIFSRAHADDRTLDSQRLVFTNLRVVWIVVLVASMVLGALWRFVIGLGFGHSYGAAQHVGYIALITATAYCLRNVVSNWLLASRRQLSIFALNSLDAITFIAVAIAFIPRYGLVGYLIAQASGACIPMFVIWAAACLKSGDRKVSIATLAAFFLTLTVFAIIAWVNIATVTWYTATAVVVAGGIAVSIMWLLFILEREERKILYDLISSPSGFREN